MTALTIILVIIVIAVLVAQANSLVTWVRNKIIDSAKWTWAFLTSPFRKEKKPRVKKAKVPRAERRRIAKEKKLRTKLYEQYILERAIYNTEYVNANADLKLLVEKFDNDRKREAHKKLSKK